MLILASRKGKAIDGYHRVCTSVDLNSLAETLNLGSPFYFPTEATICPPKTLRPISLVEYIFRLSLHFFFLLALALSAIKEMSLFIGCGEFLSPTLPPVMSVGVYQRKILKSITSKSNGHMKHNSQLIYKILKTLGQINLYIRGVNLGDLI